MELQLVLEFKEPQVPKVSLALKAPQALKASPVLVHRAPWDLLDPQVRREMLDPQVLKVSRAT
jgi:hypothetical protein